MPHSNHTIIGIDPGLGTTGWGVIRLLEGGRVAYVDSGSIRPNTTLSLAKRLCTITDQLSTQIAEYQPERLAIEKAFVGVNIESAFLLGSARAACLIAAARANLHVIEYAATHVKKAITSSGRADKQQVAFMIKTLLPQSSPDTDHAADALAVALTEAWHQPYQPYHKIINGQTNHQTNKKIPT